LRADLPQDARIARAAPCSMGGSPPRLFFISLAYRRSS
jgi:hypothetical protein